MSKTLAALGVLLIFSVSAWSSDGSTAKTSNQWLTGTWEGTGYQIDDNSTWTMRLTAGNGNFTIAYPSLNCGGVWELKRLSARRAVFRERISYGKETCTDNSTVVIERLSNRQLVVLFTNPGENEVNSSGILNRTRTPSRASGRRSSVCKDHSKG